MSNLPAPLRPGQAHYPRQHRWPLRWLPDSCVCGAHRYDRCPDAVGDALRGHELPLGWSTHRLVNAPPQGRWDEQPPTRGGRW